MNSCDTEIIGDREDYLMFITSGSRWPRYRVSIQLSMLLQTLWLADVQAIESILRPCRRVLYVEGRSNPRYSSASHFTSWTRVVSPCGAQCQIDASACVLDMRFRVLKVVEGQDRFLVV
jgi:hypothetical protein